MRLRDYRRIVTDQRPRAARTRANPADLLRNSSVRGIVRCQSGSPVLRAFLGFGLGERFIRRYIDGQGVVQFPCPTKANALYQRDLVERKGKAPDSRKESGVFLYAPPDGLGAVLSRPGVREGFGAVPSPRRVLAPPRRSQLFAEIRKECTPYPIDPPTRRGIVPVSSRSLGPNRRTRMQETP